MTRRITRIAPHRTALTVSITFSALTFLMVIPMIAMLSFGPPPVDENGNPINMLFMSVFLLIMPVFYFVFSYLIIGATAWFYNRISRITGGIEYESQEST